MIALAEKVATVPPAPPACPSGFLVVQKNLHAKQINPIHSGFPRRAECPSVVLGSVAADERYDYDRIGSSFGHRSIAADLNMPPTDRPSSAMARPRNRMWIKLRIGFTLTLVALGSGIWLRSV